MKQCLSLFALVIMPCVLPLYAADGDPMDIEQEYVPMDIEQEYVHIEQEPANESVTVEERGPREDSQSYSEKVRGVYDAIREQMEMLRERLAKKELEKELESFFNLVWEAETSEHGKDYANMFIKALARYFPSHVVKTLITPSRLPYDQAKITDGHEMMNEKIRNHNEDKFFAILGLSPEATAAEVKDAYKKLSLKWHPDKNPDNQEAATKKFQEISEAFEALKKIYNL